MLNMSELKYLINSSLIENTQELINNSYKIFENYKTGDSIGDLLENNDEYQTLIGDLEDVIEAMNHFNDNGTYSNLLNVLNHVTDNLDFDKIEGREDFENTLDNVILVVSSIRKQLSIRRK